MLARKSSFYRTNRCTNILSIGVNNILRTLTYNLHLVCKNINIDIPIMYLIVILTNVFKCITYHNTVD